MSSDPTRLRPSPALLEVFIPDRSAEIAFWSKLALDNGRIVINWHCSTGELAIGLAKQGLRIVGIDPDQEAIEIARARELAMITPSTSPSAPPPITDETAEEAPSHGMMLTWLCAEPRLVALPGAGEIAILSGETFGNYLNDEQRLGLLSNIFNYLRPGGVLGLTVPLAPASGVIHNKYISGAMRRLPKGIFARRVSTLNYNAQTQRLNGVDELLIRLPDGIEQRFEYPFVRRLYTPLEMVDILTQVGFTNFGMWGGWDRRSLRAANNFFIVRAERPLHRSVGKSPL